MINLNKYIIWTVVATVVIIAAAIIIHRINKDLDWIVNLIGIIGSIASFAGVLIAIAQTRQSNKQIQQVATTAEATAEAVRNNRQEIRDLLSIIDIVQLGERIKAAQNLILSKDFTLAYNAIQSTRDDLLRIHEMQKEDLAKAGISIESNISTLKIDMNSLSEFINAKSKQASTLKPDVIHKHLADIGEIIIKIEAHFKKQKL